MFPIILSAPESFHLFVRNEEDNWDVSIEDINSNNYDALKLHRVSFFLDVGLENGTHMGFGFDGSMIIPRNPSIQSADDAMDCFNKVKAALLLGGLQMDQTTSSHLGFGELTELGYFRYISPLGFAAQFNRALGEKGAGNLSSIVLENPRRITQYTVEKAFKTGTTIIECLPYLNSAFLVTAFSAAKKHENRSALIYGWVATEQVINHLWDDHFLKDEKYFLLQERKGTLNKIRNISQKIEILYQSRMLSNEAYKQINKARVARNTFAHGGARVPYEHVISCLKGLLLTIDTYSNLNGLASIGMSPINSFEDTQSKQRPQEHYSGLVRDIDWKAVKYWRALFAIPGDKNWKDEGQFLDGIRLVDASDELKKRPTKEKPKKK